MAGRLAVNPTRMELLRLRKRLVVAQRGHKLLKDKLDGLMQEFLEIAREYKRFRLTVDDELPYVLKLFVLRLPEPFGFVDVPAWHSRCSCIRQVRGAVSCASRGGP